MRFIPLMVLTLCCFSIHSVNAEQLFKVKIDDGSSQAKGFAMVDTITDKNRIVEVDRKGKVIWQAKLPSSINTKRICSASGIKHDQVRDIFTFIIPGQGAFEVNREGDFNKLFDDENISHDLDLLENGNFLYTRGFVNKGTASVIERNASGKIVWEWDPADHITNKDYKRSMKGIPISKKKKKKLLKNMEAGKDWAHVNGADRLPNGDTLISIRNIHRAVVVSPDGKIKDTIRDIAMIHEPHLMAGGIISADRAGNAKTKKPNMSMIFIKDGKTSKILEGKYLTVRGIEVLDENRFGFNSANHVVEADLSGKVYFDMHLKQAKPNGEANGKRQINSRCGKGPGTLYKIARTY